MLNKSILYFLHKKRRDHYERLDGGNAVNSVVDYLHKPRLVLDIKCKTVNGKDDN